MAQASRATSNALEVLDVLWNSDPDTGARLPIVRDEAMAQLRERGQSEAATLVAHLPHHAGVIDADAIDEAFLSVHFELARLSQFLHVPQRMASVLIPLISQLREGAEGPVRIIDVGCGIGLDLRHMSAHRMLGEDIEYVGIDLNSLLIHAAQRLALTEGIAVDFAVGNAFDTRAVIDDPERTIIVSQGLLHHITDDALVEFFASHAESGVAMFAHFDVNPGFWSRFGGWVLHQVRMRDAISRYDGTMSMRRAKNASTLLASARQALGEHYTLQCEDSTSWLPLPHKALRPIVGVAS